MLQNGLRMSLFQQSVFIAAHSAHSPGSAPVSLAIFSSGKAGGTADCVTNLHILQQCWEET